MNRRSLIIGILILAAAAAFLYFRKVQKPQPLSETPTPSESSESIEDNFNTTIPSSAQKITLSDLTGGNATGLAARDFLDNTFTITILADLPDAKLGTFYQAWIVKGNDLQSPSKLSLGRLAQEKGGFVVNFTVNKDYSDYNLVVVSEETQADSTIEKPILQGSF